MDLGPDLTAIPTPGPYLVLSFGAGGLPFMGKGEPSEMPACCSLGVIYVHLMQRCLLRC